MNTTSLVARRPCDDTDRGGCSSRRPRRALAATLRQQATSNAVRGL
ncbi:MAG: hypothetical protein AVDCRST_MAG11-2527 [uncultured Gemmatimonadaceae bacterium]|uniref:Uncharacterized protein n=1 Tax=uncultured Gemmatimonadaceae bacterium TaxID=246130 RepID=A0A6J4LFX2_9BACT|nr:MAG: hypothetical protein AVDCRST_MAG11-2527 [uncultured Gemmatimonadaceae bacterium]